MGAKKNGPSMASTSNEAKSGGFKGKCNFCHKFEHKKVNCCKLKAYLEKKVNPCLKVCLEYNIIDVLTNSWWLDIGATIHVTNFIPEVTSRKSPTSLEQFVYMRDGTRVKGDFWEQLDCS